MCRGGAWFVGVGRVVVGFSCLGVDKERFIFNF